MLIEKKKTAELLPAEYNPRKDLKPGDEEYEKLKRSIEEFGYVEPVIWNKTTGRVVGGHQRLKVLIKLNGFTGSGQTPTVPTQPEPLPSVSFKKGDLVKITGTKYYGGQTIPAWVKAKNWYVLQVNGSRVVIDKSEDGKNAICSPVNAADLKLVNAKPTKTVDELAREVIRGLWGNGTDRKNRLTAAGYDYYAVQARVNEILK